MKTSVNQLLKENEQKAEETVYVLSPSELRGFVITAGDFFKIEEKEKWIRDLQIWELLQEKTEEKRKNEVYQKMQEQYVFMCQLLKKVKDDDPKGYCHTEQLRALRSVKQSIANAMKEMEDYYRSEAEWEMKKNGICCGKKVLVYKNTAVLGEFSDLTAKIPKLSSVPLSWIRECPLLLSGIGDIQKAVDQKLSIGIVGGPCLFGTYEVEILISHQDGRNFSFDFSSGRRYDRKKGQVDFADHVEQYRKQIVNIEFINRKGSMTVQEQRSLEVLFAFAEKLQAKVAIPIPDISYLKYLYTVLEPIEEDLRRRTVLKFRSETRKIADLYLKRIEGLKRAYPQVEVKVLHERDRQLCREFYKKREQYFEKSGLIRRLTSKKERTDAIFDYISMLALPFYFWGTPQVIQIDNLDETDSFRKCKKVHKSDFSMSAVLYPEFLSKNGEDTIFNAPLKDKEYVEEIDEYEVNDK